MTQILFDKVLREKLLDLRQPVELCDETGKIVGRVVPVADTSGTRPYEPPPLSEEELRRREAEPGYTLEEVLARLEKL